MRRGVACIPIPVSPIRATNVSRPRYSVGRVANTTIECFRKNKDRRGRTLRSLFAVADAYPGGVMDSAVRLS
jgi:hypothetical protein